MNSLYILGISSYYHDSAAVVIKDKKILCAFEEERFTRVKHDNGFPFHAIKKCLSYISVDKTDRVVIAYYEKPLKKFERILDTFIQTYPYSVFQFTKIIPEWLQIKLRIEDTIKKEMPYVSEIFYIPHHLSHAGSSYYASGYKNAAILTIDGVGEYQTVGLWQGKNGTIEGIKQLEFPHSLGLLYSTFTAFLGFQVNEGEYKIMGLAAYGKPTYKKVLYTHLIDVDDDGSFHLNMDYFGFHTSHTMWNKKFEKLFGSPRKAHDPITKIHKDIAASIQAVTEEIYFKMLNYLYKQTQTENICLAGGVALNTVANGKIYNNTPFKNIYIFGAAGDSGGAVGAAYYVDYMIFEKMPNKQCRDICLGSKYSRTEILSALKRAGCTFAYIPQEEQLISETAALLEKNNVIAWFQGRAEFGPRALGARSILANPQNNFMHAKVNEIKSRELFRPFACSILEEKVGDYFLIPKKQKSFPFMTFCFQVKKDKKKFLAAVIHKDNTCRIQTVNKDGGRYYRLLQSFYKKTHIPGLLNTSFNRSMEPIVETPEQAIETFLKTNIDYLVIEDFIIKR